MDAVERVRALTGLEMQPLQAQRHLAARAALSQMDARRAIGAAPSEAAMESALRMADAYRAQIADLERQVESLKRSNAALRLAAQPDRAKAALIDHVVAAEDSSLVLCHATYNASARRWSFSPLSTLEEARRVMEGDLERAAAEDDAECTHCAGTGEGQHEGAACLACRGRG